MEKFAFTKVFQEEASQLDIFNGTGAISLVEGVLGEGKDGLLATLGVTGSGKVGLDIEQHDVIDANLRFGRVIQYLARSRSEVSRSYPLIFSTDPSISGSYILRNVYPWYHLWYPPTRLKHRFCLHPAS